MTKEEPAILVVQVQPNASQNRITRFKDGVLHVKVAAPPVKGKANRELIEFLSDILGVNKSNLTIQKGVTGKKKTILVKGLTPDKLMGRLNTLTPLDNQPHLI